MTITEVRAVSGYALAQTDAPSILRSVNGYVLIDQVQQPPFSVAGLTGLLAAINREKGTSLTSGVITFADPTPSATPTEWNNTSIQVTAKKVSGYRGSYTFIYHRTAISDGFNGQPLDLPASVGTTIWGTLDAINAKFNIKLEQRDVADGPIAPGATSILLTTLASSIYYTPGSTVRLGSSDADVPFATVAPVTDALGFDPVGVFDYPFADIAPVTDVLGFDPEA